MSSPAFETILVRLYTDPHFRRDFFDDPESAAQAAGLSPEETDALRKLDRVGLRAAAASFAKKRAKGVPSRPSLFARIRARLHL